MRALAAAADRAGLRRIVYLSILGSHPSARNACLASKGRAEQILLGGAVPALVLRVPMVIGPATSCRARCARRRARASCRCCAAARAPSSRSTPTTSSPRSCAGSIARAPGTSRSTWPARSRSPRRELLARTARLWGGRRDRDPAALRARARDGLRSARSCSRSPAHARHARRARPRRPRSTPSPPAARSGSTLTPLDETLRRCVGPGSEPRERAAAPAGARLAARAAAAVAAHAALLRLLYSKIRAGGARGRDAAALHRARSSAGELDPLARADGPLLRLLPADRLPRDLARDQLVQHAGALSRHPADPGQRLHHLDPRRADRQGRDRLLPAPARRRPGLAGGLVMLFVMFCELFYLLSWATLGVALRGATCRRGRFPRSRGSRWARRFLAVWCSTSGA